MCHVRVYHNYVRLYCLSPSTYVSAFGFVGFIFFEVPTLCFGNQPDTTVQPPDRRLRSVDGSRLLLQSVPNPVSVVMAVDLKLSHADFMVVAEQKSTGTIMELKFSWIGDVYASTRDCSMILFGFFSVDLLGILNLLVSLDHFASKWLSDEQENNQTHPGLGHHEGWQLLDLFISAKLTLATRLLKETCRHPQCDLDLYSWIYIYIYKCHIIYNYIYKRCI